MSDRPATGRDAAPAGISPHPATGPPRAIFIVGAPRSGTTLLGNYLGSHPTVLNLGEYGGFHLAYNIAGSTMGALPGPFRDDYLADLASHARRFAEGLAADQGCDWYCDATPWNILVADQFDADLVDAVYVLALRHYAGTVQSLRRSFAGGFHWAGAGWAESAGVWSRCYQAVAKLPVDRTIPISYDALAGDPRLTLTVLQMRLEEHGFDSSALDSRQLAVSHAPPVGPYTRPTIGQIHGDEVDLHPIRSFEPEHWSGDIHRAVWPVVGDVHRDLQQRFEGVYRSPPPPPDLHAHDDVDGLVAVEIGDDW